MAGPGRLRFPAIDIPRTAAQDVKVAVTAIKERIEALESALDTANKTAQAGITALKSTVSTTTTGSTVTGNVQSFGTITPIPGGVAVYMSGNQVVAVADPTVLAQCFGCIGVTTGASSGGKVSVALASAVVAVPLGFVPFTPVFAGPAGAL